MEPTVLDHVTERLEALLARREQFARKYGARAAGFLDPLPMLFRLFHRLTFDLDVPPEHRRKAASVAVYIAEDFDFRSEGSFGVEGLLDDLWLAYTCLGQLSTTVPPDILRRHWLSTTPFELVCEQSQRLAILEPLIPPKVLELLRTFVA